MAIFGKKAREARKEKREKKYWEAVMYVVQNGLEPTHGPHGSDMGSDVQGYVIPGHSGVVFISDEHVAMAKEKLEAVNKQENNAQEEPKANQEEGQAEPKASQEEEGQAE